ncbi:peptide-methionine (R)-S-oxide reductase MsrB [Verrucomicrobiales bacterium]|nr:peptide-methionine (R)-S-oxide reductase MsrB [Verrucomicrobiales bacterium]|tara:strand:+ start:1613 stop:2209 length:597 start_codon:yes stop_codon:yes gene_type:complete
MKSNTLWILPFAMLVALVAFYAVAEETEKSNTAIEVLAKAPEQPTDFVKKTDEEWKKELTPEQYRILREAGTEPADGDVYKEFKNQGGGTYYCAGCNAELFTSTEKFDSHCGWPSFYDPSKARNVKYNVDYHLGYARTEVVCKRCEGHLGHVFEGEKFDTPTDKRYCINGTVLKFVPAKDEGKKVEATDDKTKEKKKE